MIDTIETIWDHRDLFTVLANLDYAALAKCSLFVFIITAIVNYFLKSYIPLLLTLVLAGIVFILWSNKDYKPSIMVAVTAITLFAGSSLGGFLGGCAPSKRKKS